MTKISANLTDGNSSVQWLMGFIRESNGIEGIWREPTEREVLALEGFIELDEVSVTDIAGLVAVFQPGANIRNLHGMDVQVGGFFPMDGGPRVPEALRNLLMTIDNKTPWKVHVEYETLHPFMDGNGRSGRALWLWKMRKIGSLGWVKQFGFLQSFYYQTLQHQQEDD